MTEYPTRMWINQPSKNQPLHKLNGTNVLAVRELGGMYRIYFLSGDTISMRCPRYCLSTGWVSLSQEGTKLA